MTITTAPVAEALAQGAIALIYFFLAAFEGNPRVLRVIDSRRDVVVVRTAQYFATQNYGTAKHLSQLQSHSNNNTNNARNSSSQLGSRAGGSGAVTGSLELKPLLTDNRFLLGILAAMTGVLRCAYVLAVLFNGTNTHNGNTSNNNNNNNSNGTNTSMHSLSSSFSSSSTLSFFAASRLQLHPHSATTTSTEMTSESVINDVITIPLAILSYSLVLAVLFAHRDLMSKIRGAYDSVYNNANGNNNNNDQAPSRTSGGDESLAHQQRTSTTPSQSNLLRRNSAEHDQISATTGTTASTRSNPRFTPGSRIIISPLPRKTTSPMKRSASTDFPSQPILQNTSKPNLSLSNINNNNNNNNSSTASSVNIGQENSNHNTESMEINSTSTTPNLNNTNNNNNNSSQPRKPFKESELYVKWIRPYRALWSMLLVGVILMSSLVVEAITDNVTISEYCSPCVSLILGLWSLYSFVESYARLRFFGKASHRVIVAILILTLYLLTRGVIVLPPVQEKLCKNNGENFWSCFFVFSIVDGAGLLISMLVLP